MSSMSFYYNAILKPVENHKLDIVVTDLATSIQDYVDHYKKHINQLI